MLSVALLSAYVVAPAPQADAQSGETQRLSQRIEFDEYGPFVIEGNDHSPPDLHADGPNVAISDDGQSVAFSSAASNLLGERGDTNGVPDVFRYDAGEDTLARVSVQDDTGAQAEVDPEDELGAQGSGINQIDISADGNRVVFESRATNLVPGVTFTSDLQNVYVRDVSEQRTWLASGHPGGELTAIGGARNPAISGDGRYVVFQAQIGDMAGVWRRDLEEDALEEVATFRQEGELPLWADNPAISHDGRYVAFATQGQFHWSDAAGFSDVYVRDMEAADEEQQFTYVSRAHDWAQERSPNGHSFLRGPNAISADGSRVVFSSDAQNLVPEDFNGETDVFVAELVAGEEVSVTLTPATVEPDGTLSEGSGGDHGQLSSDGRFVAFRSSSTSLTDDSPFDDLHHVFIRDLERERTDIGSRNSQGVAADGTSGHAVLSAAGRHLAFASDAQNLVEGGSRYSAVYLRDLRDRDQVDDAIGNLSLTVEPESTPAGISTVDPLDLDVATMPLLPGDPGDASIETSPMRFSPMRFSPMRFSPMRFSPMRFSPMRFSPMRFSPMRFSPMRFSPMRFSPLAAAQLPPMPLSTVPLLLDGGWSPRLVGTPYEGLPLQSVLLQDLFALMDAEPGQHPQLEEIDLGHIDFTLTPLGQSTIAGFAFSGPTLDELSSSSDWCGTLASHGFDCAGHGISEATSTLLDLDLAGAPLHELAFLPRLPVNDAALTQAGRRAVIADYDLGTLNLAASALGDLALADLDAGLLATAIDCGLVDCATATLAQAADADAIHGRLEDGDTPAVLGDLLATPAFQALDLEFADLLRMVVNSTTMSFAGVPLDNLIQGVPIPTAQDEDGVLVRYTAGADVACPQAGGLVMVVGLPKHFRYSPGSAQLRIDDGDWQPAGEPSTGSGDDGPIIIDGGALTHPPALREAPPAADDNVVAWQVPAAADCEGRGAAGVELAFLVQPGVELGAKTSSLTVFTDSAGPAVLPHAAPISVTEAFEDNASPDTATPIEPGTLYLSHISHGDDVDYFALPDGLEPGTRIIATLSHLTADFDLALHGPTAEPVLSSPMRFSPMRFSPMRFSPVEDHGLTRAPEGETLAPDTLQDVHADDTALSQSAKRGTADETVTHVVTASSGGPFLLSVAPYLGAHSALPYVLQVLVDEPPQVDCTGAHVVGATGPAGSLPTLPGSAAQRENIRTLVLVNEQRYRSLHGDGAVGELRGALQSLPTDEAGVPLVLPVDGDAAVRGAYQAWDADLCSPEAANDVVREINRLVDGYAEDLPNLRFVTIVGDDNVVPHARIPDHATLANQLDYYPQVVFEADNPISAAAAHAYLLSDNAYGDLRPLEWLDHQLHLPDWAVGRLVESHADIMATLDQYTARPYLDMDSSLSAAYDFSTDAGVAIDGILAGHGVGDADRSQLLDDSWSRTDLVADLDQGRSVASVNAHYDHSFALPAAADAAATFTVDDLFSTGDLSDGGMPAGALLFTIGCQAGLNVPDVAWVGATPEQAARLLDFAQAVARKSGGSFFANTSYGYGDDDAIAYSERLMTLFAEHLDGSMTLGQAVLAAKEAYLGELGVAGVYDAKVVQQAVFYGLPFTRVGPDGGMAPGPTVPPTEPPADLQPDPETGVPFLGFDEEQTFTDTPATGGRSYRTVDGHQPLLTHYRPILPTKALSLPRPPEGRAIGDVLFTGLTQEQDRTGVAGVFATPIFDSTAHEPEVVAGDVAFPAALGNTTPSRSLVLLPGQYRSDPAQPGTGTERLFTRMTGKVFYPEDVDTPRPFFTDVEATDVAGTVAFRVEVDPAEFVLVLYKPAGNTWRSLELAESASGVWTGAVADDVTEYFVQAVHQGAVGATRAKGDNFVPEPAPTVTGFTFDIAGPDLVNGWYPGAAQVTIIPDTDGVPFEYSLNGAPFEPVDGPITVDQTGANRIDVRGADGSSGAVLVPVDVTPPTIRITTPAEGQVFAVGQHVDPDYACSDAGSGIQSCEVLSGTPLDTSQGTHTFRVRATDRVGHVTIREVTYSAEFGYRFEGFFPPVNNPPTFNVVKAGRVIPVKFRLLDALDRPVTDPSVVTGVTWRAVDCDTLAPQDPVEETPGDGASANELNFDLRDQQFVYTAQTLASWRDSCRELLFEFGNDAAPQRALFRFTR